MMMNCPNRTKIVLIKVICILLHNDDNHCDLLCYLFSGGCYLSIVGKYLDDLGYEKKKNHSLGESIEKGELKTLDILFHFGPFFTKMDLAIKLFALRIWFKKPFVSGKKELKFLLDSYLIKIIKEFATDVWLGKYWDYKISSKPNALTSIDRIWRIVTTERNNRLDAALKMFLGSSPRFAFGALAGFVSHIPTGKGTIIVPRGQSVISKPFLSISAWYSICELFFS